MVKHNDKIITLLLWCLGAVCGFYSYPVQAQGCTQDQAVARVVSTQGRVALNQNAAGRGDLLCPGDIVQVGPFSRAALIMLATETTVRIDQESVLRLPRPAQREQSLLDLIKGALYLFSREPPALDVYTPYVNAAVEGTEFLVRAAEDRSFITVFEGRILASNAQGQVRIGSNQTAVAGAGEAPRLIETVRPEDAVQWALYYQPVLAALYAPESSPEGLRRALGELDYRDPAAVIERLDQIPPAAQDDFYQVFRAAWLLAVGQSQAAQALLDAVLQAQPDNGNAQALAAIIAVTQNDKAQALTVAQQAVQNAPQSAATWLALSYAQQAQFDLDGALASTQTASERDPTNALVWARLSELWLSKGELDQALSAAQQAAERNPNIGRTQSVLGFAYLTRIDIDQARQAFERAIELDQADPQPRLGLGLAKIRQGELEPGREELAIAVSLDPLNSLLRSYLGKAYFEEKRAPLASTQYEIAKDLDRLDPTPWLYDALLKQAENRPVEALQDIQKSIELNDNRAVYRSRLLLDEDEAVRGASLARIYNNLKFEKQALVQAAKSLSIDPLSYSAHRFLSDIYAARSRHEIARVSELLQTQLLQPINIDPLQPQFVEVDLNLATPSGLPNMGFNEFTPLFEREGYQFNISSFGGNNDTWGNEVLLSGVQNKFSYSLGQFHYETEGFRKNSDNKSDLFNVFIQSALTPDLNLQVEYRNRNSDQGDLELRFDPQVFFPDDRLKVEQETARIGSRYTLSEQSDILISYAYTDRASKNSFIDPGRRADLFLDEEGFQIEGQYLYRADHFNITTGVGKYDVGVNRRRVVTEDEVSISDTSSKFSREQNDVYIYSNLFFSKDIIWTLGASYTSFKQRVLEVEELNPKLGLQWNIAENLLFRVGAFQTVKRALAIEQTIEPTHIAGFNQLFDDANGTKSSHYGIGIDYQLANEISVGFELSKRDLDFPSTPGNNVVILPENEEAAYSYFYWTPHPNWSLSFEYQWDKFESKEGVSFGRPRKVETTVIPLTIRYFNRRGYFGEFGATFVDQAFNQDGSSLQNDDFVLYDTMIGYRLPNRLGVIGLEINNIFEEEFNFRDDRYRSAKTRNPRFTPGRTIYAYINLNF